MNNQILNNTSNSLKHDWENHNQFVWGLLNNQIKKYFNK